MGMLAQLAELQPGRVKLSQPLELSLLLDAVVRPASVSAPRQAGTVSDWEQVPGLRHTLKTVRSIIEDAAQAAAYLGCGSQVLQLLLKTRQPRRTQPILMQALVLPLASYR
eukprot:gene12552-12685_t